LKPRDAKVSPLDALNLNFEPSLAVLFGGQRIKS
jgi:hypothetical protein